MTDILKVHHVGYVCASLEKTIAFWCGALDFPPGEIQSRSGWIQPFMGVPADTEVRLAHLIGHGTHIEFIEFTPGQSPEHSPMQRPATAHVCIQVAGIEAVRDRILALGGILQGELVTITTGISSGSRGLYARDPNGIMIELIEPAGILGREPAQLSAA